MGRTREARIEDRIRGEAAALEARADAARSPIQLGLALRLRTGPSEATPEIQELHGLWPQAYTNSHWVART